jgi:hypothetical protein
MQRMHECRVAYSHINNKKGKAMIQRPDKVRQAGLIIFAITVLLILPNLSRFVS